MTRNVPINQEIYFLLHVNNTIKTTSLDYYLLSFTGALPVSALLPPTYFTLPQLQGTYLCLIMCRICLFIVITNKIIKYNNKIGQKTGILKTSKKVIPKAVMTAFVLKYQNLNSGTRRANGL